MKSKTVHPNRHGAFRAIALMSIFALMSTFTFCLMLCISDCAPGYASGDSLIPDIKQLEMKFYSHDYPDDTTEIRLERLEKTVFGESQTGSEDDRLTKLLVAMPSSNPDQTNADSGQSNLSNQTPPLANEQPAHDLSSPAGSQVQPDSTTTRGGNINTDGSISTDYPTVDALEKQILGQSYTQEPIQDRLNTLESKAFGHPSSSDDLSARVDKLKQYAGINDIQEEQSPQSIAQPFPQSSINYPSDDFSSASSAANNATGGTTAWSAPASTYEIPSAGLNSPYSNQQNNNSPAKSHPFWHGLGKALEAVGSLAVGSLSNGMMYGGGYPYYGGGMYSPYGMGPTSYGLYRPYGGGFYY